MTAPNSHCPRCHGAGWVELSADAGDRRVTTEVSCPHCCAPPDATVEWWRAAHGWAVTPAPCRTCGRPTHCHDLHGFPRHLHCSAQCTGQLGFAWASN
jgi:hypothetical protein